jgi:hypothetical protein
MRPNHLERLEAIIDCKNVVEFLQENGERRTDTRVIFHDKDPRPCPSRIGLRQKLGDNPREHRGDALSS